MQDDAIRPVWGENFKVRSFDIGINGKIRLSNLCGYFQEVAGKHAEHLGLGYQFVQTSGFVWVLSRLYIEVHRYPSWGEEFMLETWPLPTERIFYRRDYRLSVGGTTYISAASFWILLDIKTRRPKVVPVHEKVLQANRQQHALEVPDKGIPAVHSPSRQEFIQARYSDLDQNMHVNNARYVEWVFDCIGVTQAGDELPDVFSIEYKNEVKSGDWVNLKLENVTGDQPAYVVEGTTRDSVQVCFRAYAGYRNLRS
jgi:acyl-ACP thioesterase